MRGPVGAFAGVLGYYAFAGVFTPLQRPRRVRGPRQLPAPVRHLGALGGGRGGRAQFLDGYDGAQVVWEGKEITSLGYVDTPSVVGSDPATATPRLYAGFADGTYGWVTQPRGGPNPFDPDAGVEFTTGLSFLRWPRHSMDAPADLKAYLSFDVSGPYLDPYRWVDVQYRVDADGEGAPWEPLARPLWQTAERVMLPAPTLGRIIEVRGETGPRRPRPAPGPAPSPYPPGPTLAEWTRLQTPVLAAVVLREQLRPAYRAEYGLTLRATDWGPPAGRGHLAPDGDPDPRAAGAGGRRRRRCACCCRTRPPGTSPW